MNLIAPLCLLWQWVAVQGFAMVPDAMLQQHTRQSTMSVSRIASTKPDEIFSCRHAAQSNSARSIHLSSRGRSLTVTTLSATRKQPAPPPTQQQQLSPLEDWCAREVEEWYQKAMLVKCPFFKRRFVDILDAVDMVLRFLVIRHKSLDIFGPPPGHRSKLQKAASDKAIDLSISQRLEAIRRDWAPATAMGYYITGNLNTTLYRDDCLFDGPDPDMPVSGLRKYVNAASQLFDRSQSRAALLSLDIVVDDDSPMKQIIVAKWHMKGVLRLPWKPNLPEWTGSTRYHFDDQGLIYRHEEVWDMSVMQAFMKTFAPELAQRIWPEAIVASTTR